VLTQNPLKWLYEYRVLRVKLPQGEADYKPPSSAMIKKKLNHMEGKKPKVLW
jgi:hypothetical protein